MDNTGSPVMDASNDQKRRSSSRSIKRRRFDDELVDYSPIPAQVSRFARSRTQSHATPPTPTTPKQPQLEASSPLAQQLVQSPPAAPQVQPKVKSPIVPPQILPQAPKFQEPAPVVQITAPAAAVAVSPVQVLPVVSTASTPVPSTAAAAPVVYAPPANPTAASLERRCSKVRPSSSRRNKKNRSGQQLTATKDLGRWKPIDDLTLIIGIQQTNDLRTVLRGCKFSCKFTLPELQKRWYSLLYDEPISRIAFAAMKNLHPELVESIQKKALYNSQEEDLIATIKSTDSPTLATFQELFNKNASTFYPSRTAKSLLNHWNLMKQYLLLSDQNASSQNTGSAFVCLPDGDTNIHFSDQEDRINDGDLLENRDEVLELELALADRKCKKEIRHLENELPRWTVLVDSFGGLGNPPVFDSQTLAILRGRLVRYLMRSREITIGRKSRNEKVDVDLSLEGPAIKVSRRQGTIKLRSNGDFFILNEGKQAIYIDGRALFQGERTKLSTNSMIEIAGLRIVFLVNVDLIKAIRQESAKMNGPLN